MGKRVGNSQSGRGEFGFALVCRATEIGAGKRQKYSFLGRVEGRTDLDVGGWAPRCVRVVDCGLLWMCCQEEAAKFGAKRGGGQRPKMDDPASPKIDNHRRDDSERKHSCPTPLAAHNKDAWRFDSHIKGVLKRQRGSFGWTVRLVSFAAGKSGPTRQQTGRKTGLWGYLPTEKRLGVQEAGAGGGRTKQVNQKTTRGLERHK